MNHFKRLTAVAAMTLFVAGLAACGNEAVESGGKTEATSAEAAETDAETETDLGEAEASANAAFLQIAELLETEGLNPSEPLVGENDVKGSVDNAWIVVDGEDMLPLQIYEMEPGDENLETAKDTGEVTLSFDGMEGEVPVELIKDNYVIFFAEGHPDRDQVIKLIDEQFKPE